MQLVGEVMGQISDALDRNKVPDFDETKLSNDWGRILLEAAGSATIAGATGGNVGAATASSIGGNIATASSFAAIKQWAKAQSNGDEIVATLLTNAIENAIAGAIGAGAGGAMNGGSGALNGLGISSDLQQYNQAAEPPEEDFRPEDHDENGRLIDPLQEAIWKLSYYNNERELRELCKDCSSLTSINSTITEDMVNLSGEELDAARQLALLGKPVNSWNIDRVKNGQIDYIDPVADPARGNPSETIRPKPTQPTETQWNDFDNNGENNRGKSIILENGFYSVDGMKMSQSYYERLWREGRPAPFVQAQEVLNSNPKITPDPRGEAGYLKYEASGLEMIYNPTTGQIGHIQPIRTK